MSSRRVQAAWLLAGTGGLAVAAALLVFGSAGDVAMPAEAAPAATPDNAAADADPPAPQSPAATGPAPEGSPPPARAALPAGKVLRGVVVDPQGAPRAGLEVRLEHVFRRDLLPLPAVSGADGAVLWPAVVPGVHRLGIAGFDVDEPLEVTVERDGEPPPVRIVCQPEQVLAGRVLDDDGAPVPGASVIVEDPSGAEVAKCGTAADGTFRVQRRARDLADQGARLWVYSRGRFAMAGKHEARWGEREVVLRVHDAPAGTLLVTDRAGNPVRDYRLWIDLPPAARAEAPWVVDGWIPFAPGTSPRLPGLGLVAQRLSIYPADHRFECCALDVPAGEACRDVQVALGSSPELAVRTVPAVAGAQVDVLRPPPAGVVRSQYVQPDRARANPLREDEVVLVASGRTGAAGRAVLHGGSAGQAVWVCAAGGGLAGEAQVTLAEREEIVVPMAPPGSVELVLEPAPPARERHPLYIERLAPGGGPDPLARTFRVEFGGAVDPLLLLEMSRLERQQERDRLQLWVRAVHDRDRDALAALLADPFVGRKLHQRLEALREQDPSRCRLAGVPAGRYRVVRRGVEGSVPRVLAEFALAPGAHREQVIALRSLARIELVLALPADRPFPVERAIDEATGVAMQLAELRPARVRLFAAAADGSLWLSEDVLALPEEGRVEWRPALAPMRVELRVSARGMPLAGRAVSRLPAHEPTAGWHGRPLGRTDARGMLELRSDASPCKLRVDGVAPLLGPIAPDLRRHQQVIEVEVPER